MAKPEKINIFKIGDNYNGDVINFCHKKGEKTILTACFNYDWRIPFKLVNADDSVIFEGEGEYTILFDVDNEKMFTKMSAVEQKEFDRDYNLMFITKGILISRFAPFHLGHEHIINKMKKFFNTKDCVLFIGSSSTYDKNTPFTYLQRKEFITTVFPDIFKIGIPDHKHYDQSGDAWCQYLWDMINWKFEWSKQDNTMFFAGCEEDVSFFIERGYNVYIERRDGSISGTLIRQKLMIDEDISELVNPKIKDIIVKLWKKVIF